MKKLSLNSEFYTEIFPLQLLQYAKKYLLLDDFITLENPLTTFILERGGRFFQPPPLKLISNDTFLLPSLWTWISLPTPLPPDNMDC